MSIFKLQDCEEFIAGDNSILREIFNPLKQNLNLNYSLAYAKVKPKTKTLPHKLKCSEVYYILNGKGIMCIDDKKQSVEENDTVYIKPEATQYIENTGNTELIFLCIVDPAWEPSVEEVV